MSAQIWVGFLLVGCFIVTAGCASREDTSYLTPIPEATLKAHRSGSPIRTKLEAVIAGRSQLLITRLIQLDTPAVVSAEEMSFEQANWQIGRNNPPYPFYPRETRVWLVLFEGDWQVMPPNPTNTVPLPPPYHGCVCTVLAAAGGEPISTGDTPCPPQ